MGDFAWACARFRNDGRTTRWFVEVVTYTGNRIASVSMSRPEAVTTAQEIMSDAAVLVVSMVNERTAEAIWFPSHALRASAVERQRRWVDVSDRELLEEACGPPRRSV